MMRFAFFVAVALIPTAAVADRAKAPSSICAIEEQSIDICRERLGCHQIATCAEAFYRLNTRNHRELDGGIKPAPGQPNLIPCERSLCGGAVDAMWAKFAARTFQPPAKSVRVCRYACDDWQLCAGSERHVDTCRPSRHIRLPVEAHAPCGSRV